VASKNDWDLASEAHRRCWEAVDPAEGPVSDRLIELGQIGVGETVLDVATGIGEPALRIARRVGPAGLVIAIDQSSAMLAVAAARAREEGLSNIDFRQMDANFVELREQTVQAIVSRWGLMFLTDLADALGRMRRHLVSDRRLVAAVWSEPEKVPIITLRRKVMRAFGIAPGIYDPFSLSSEHALSAAALAGGFTQVRIDRMSVAYEFPSAEAYAELQQELHASRLASLRERPPEEQAKFWRALSDEARSYADHDGVVHLPSEVLLLTAAA